MTARLLLATALLWLSACAHRPAGPCAGPFVPVNRPATETPHDHTR